MIDDIGKLKSEISSYPIKNLADLEQFRIKYLGSKGILKQWSDELSIAFKNATPEYKREKGGEFAELKNLVNITYTTSLSHYQLSETTTKTDIDLTLPGDGFAVGSRHPLSLVRNEIIDIFKRLGFVVAEGPEIEDDWHNFSALNFPEEHPARDMQDTFFIKKNNGKDDIALRTHTSSVQVRMMENGKPPFRAIMPGRVYRNEAISARAHCFFHQVEGLYVDENVSFADLKQTLYHFVQELYGEGTKVRFRPSYFPFTEPSAEMDVSCTICGGSGCNMCKYSGWVEILGCGMVDPNVLENCGIDSKVYTGFAFGMGMERIANLKYVIRDLRLFSENDARFLKQFQTEII
ncbi:MAG TPA: phenylalanine--tRNA ligase subunit alpha [Mucilaginibacter sp.]|jgi:phenylalanyl-tRNA synthetase alpha chain|nr:phenylalanine--tRNA ligase subunit alpha [Mucilaginibacter sp.]